eukprot:scaffold1401_cov330-Pavlova_lutheri.AAC.48
MRMPELLRKRARVANPNRRHPSIKILSMWRGEIEPGTGATQPPPLGTISELHTPQSMQTRCRMLEQVTRARTASRHNDSLSRRKLKKTKRVQKVPGNPASRLRKTSCNVSHRFRRHSCQHAAQSPPPHAPGRTTATEQQTLYVVKTVHLLSYNQPRFPTATLQRRRTAAGSSSSSFLVLPRSFLSEFSGPSFCVGIAISGFQPGSEGMVRQLFFFLLLLHCEHHHLVLLREPAQCGSGLIQQCLELGRGTWCAVRTVQARALSPEPRVLRVHGQQQAGFQQFHMCFSMGGDGRKRFHLSKAHGDQKPKHAPRTLHVLSSSLPAPPAHVLRARFVQPGSSPLLRYVWFLLLPLFARDLDRTERDLRANARDGRPSASLTL